MREKKLYLVQKALCRVCTRACIKGAAKTSGETRKHAGVCVHRDTRLARAHWKSFIMYAQRDALRCRGRVKRRFYYREDAHHTGGSGNFCERASALYLQLGTYLTSLWCRSRLQAFSLSNLTAAIWR